MTKDKVKNAEKQKIVKSVHSMAENLMAGVIQEAGHHVVEIDESSKSPTEKHSIDLIIDSDKAHEMAENIVSGVLNEAENHAVEEIEQTSHIAKDIIDGVLEVSKNHLIKMKNNDDDDVDDDVDDEDDEV